MHKIDIYRGQGLFATIIPADNSSQVKRIMGDNTLNIQFQDSRNLIFKINDYCTVFGEKYKIYELPADKKINKNLYEYTLVFRQESYDLMRAQFLLTQPVQTDFSFTGKIDDFLALVLQNINRINPGWTAGHTIPSGFKTMAFNGEKCLQALARIAEEFGTEYYINGKEISLAKKEKATGLTFKHGKNQGLWEVNRAPLDDSALITRLYAEGAEKNLPTGYRNYSKRLKMAGGVDYVESNVNTYGLIEYSQVFDDIYPHRTGKVTGVDLTDPSIFSDSSMDFDINSYLLPGTTAKIVFNSGDLSGYTFDINFYDSGVKRFRINKNTEEKTLDLPSSTFRPRVGDEYVIIDINMPQSYIDAAELELKNRALQFLQENSNPKRSFTVTLDPLYIERNNIQLNIGDVIWVTDNEFQINQAIRVIQTTRNIVEEYQYSVELSDQVNKNIVAQLSSGVNSNTRSIDSINRQLDNNAILNNRVKGDFYFENLPIASSLAGLKALYIEPTSGKLFRAS